MDDEETDDGVLTVVIGDERTDDPGHPMPGETRDWDLDEVCAAAADTARAALLDEADEAVVGEHLGVLAEGPLVVTHYFAGTVPGYAGWRWAVTVTRAPDSDTVTVDETALLPDGDALLAPVWVPWKQRIQPGDLGAGDVLVTEPDDPRLLPGMGTNDVPDDDDDQIQPLQWELGLGRVRVLSPEGRREAAQRWYREVGPRSPVARNVDLECASCGFLVLIGGPMGQAFGVCANGYSPADGRVVAMTFGCGAHSETIQTPPVGVAEIVVDEAGYDDMGATAEEPADAEQPQDGHSEGQGPVDPVQADGAAPPPEEPQEDPSVPPEPVDSPQDVEGDGHATMQEPDPQDQEDA